FATVTLAGYETSPCCWAEKPAPNDPGKTRIEAARKLYERWARQYAAGSIDAEGVHQWSSRLMEAETQLVRQQKERISAAEAHLGRMRDLQKLVRQVTANRRSSLDSYLAADNYCAEAEI